MVGSVEEVEDVDIELDLVGEEDVFKALRDLEEFAEGEWAGPGAIGLGDEEGDDGRKVARGVGVSGEAFEDAENVSEDAEREAWIGGALVFEEHDEEGVVGGREGDAEKEVGVEVGEGRVEEGGVFDGNGLAVDEARDVRGEVMLEESGGVGGRGEDALEEVIVGLMEGMVRHAGDRVRAVHVHRAGRVDGWGESLGNRLR